MSTVYARSFLYSMWDRLFSALCVCVIRSAAIGRACGIARNCAAAGVMRQPETSPLRSRLDEIRTAVALLRR